MGVRFFVGSHAHSIGGEPVRIDGDRCLTPVHQPPKHADPRRMTVLTDSGAFTDVSSDKRLTPEAALQRQLRWEERAANLWDAPFTSHALVTYDRLIDEQLIDGRRQKVRWSVAEADSAVEETIAAAHYLASRRRELAPRHLVLSCQGVTATQFRDAAIEILKVADPDDWFGVGGYCLLGRQTRWLPEFRRTLALTLPLIARSGISHVHLFGVLFEPALASLLWAADQHGISVSTDSTAPVLAATRGNAKKAGMRGHDWRSNVDHWRRHLANLRQSRWYGPFDASVQATLPGMAHTYAKTGV